MNSRLSHIFILLGALVAFLPILAVDYVLDSYVRDRESRRMITSIQSLSNEVQRAAYSGVSALQHILNDSPSLCTPTFVTNVQKQLRENIYLNQVLVENGDGVQYCDAYGGTLSYMMLSNELAIPGTSETLAVVRLEGEPLPYLKIRSGVGSNRSISAFVHLSPRLLNGLPEELTGASLLRLELTDGSEVMTFGDPALRNLKSQDYIEAHVVADALPLLIIAVEPFAVVRAGYADLDVAITVIASTMSIIFLVLAFHYVRSARLPAFDLERAIENGELRPYYQPIFNISNGKLSGCEVLIRWEKKGGKLVAPGLFIDYAEATGLAIPMTIKLMEQVRADLSPICAVLPKLKVGINLFEGHFRDTAIVEDVQAIFEDSGISYRQLVFEITERRPLEDQLATKSVIGGLHALGCRIAMDDAGTGHSNLEYLHTLGIDVLKIDRVFISMIGDGTKPVPVLDGLIGMAENMDLDIVAEGVETQEEAIYLRKHGVYEAQGFLFAPALKAATFIELATKINETEFRSGDLAETEGSGSEEAAESGSEDEAA